MAVEVVMPRLGWDMEEGSLVEWLKKDGETVQPGEIMCTIEGDKAVNEVESLDSGVLRIPPDSPPPGAKVPVGTVLAYLVGPGEAPPFELAPARAASVAPVDGAAPAAATAAGVMPRASIATAAGAVDGPAARG